MFYNYIYSLEIRRTWDDFRDVVRNGNYNAARAFIHDDSKQWFDEFIKRLGDNAPRLADELSAGAELQSNYTCGNEAVFFTFIEADIFGTGPELFATPVSFLRTEDGSWMINKF